MCSSGSRGAGASPVIVVGRKRRDTQNRGEAIKRMRLFLCFLFCFPLATQSRPIFLYAGPVLGECVSSAGPAGSALGMGTDTTVTLKTLRAKSRGRGQKEIKIFQMRPDKQVHRNSSTTIC